MTSRAGSQRERRGRAAAGVVLLSALLAIVFVACGISLGEVSEETEIFLDVRVEGEFTPRRYLTVFIEYEQPYPEPIVIACDLLEANPQPAPESEEETDNDEPPRIPRVYPTPKGAILSIMSEAIPENPDGGPVGEATPVLGEVDAGFFAPAVPGDYEVFCYTPGDPNNAISTDITIRAEG